MIEPILLINIRRLSLKNLLEYINFWVVQLVGG